MALKAVKSTFCAIRVSATQAHTDDVAARRTTELCRFGEVRGVSPTRLVEDLDDVHGDAGSHTDDADIVVCRTDGASNVGTVRTAVLPPVARS